MRFLIALYVNPPFGRINDVVSTLDEILLYTYPAKNPVARSYPMPRT
ncbi:MAG: hypothetical protein MUP44_09575 [Anaerolineales bacterium]|nr:hypothetical protein [Anaerolineales bacterium]